MAITNWSSRYETGIDIIDSQHRNLFKTVNELADSFRSGSSTQQTKVSLDFLVHYTVEHFQTEEAHMKELDYPGLMSHVAEHCRLFNQAKQFQSSLAAGGRVTMELVVFLADWLKHHIDEIDMDYVKFSASQGKSQVAPSTALPTIQGQPGES